MWEYDHDQLAFILALQLAAENQGHKSDRAKLLERFPKLADQLELYFESGDIAITCGCCDMETYQWKRALTQARQLVATLKPDDVNFLFRSYLQNSMPNADAIRSRRRLAMIGHLLSQRWKDLRCDSPL